MNAFLAAVVVFTPILVVVIQVYGRRDTKRKTEELKAHVQESRDVLSVKADEIHILVNARMAQALARIKALEEALGIQEGDPIPEKTNED